MIDLTKLISKYFKIVYGNTSENRGFEFGENFYEYKDYKIHIGLGLYDHYTRIATSNNANKRKASKCIYCDKELRNSKVNHAHLIPELFGKNNSHNLYECNECNNLSGNWETSLGTFTTPLRVISQVRNKKGKIPKFKSRLDNYNSQSVIYFDENGTLKAKLATEDDWLFDPLTQIAKLKFRLGSYNPYDVFKAFLKIAISLMPDSILKEQKWMIDCLYLNGPNEWIFPTIFLVFLEDKKLKEPYIELLQLKNINENYPNYILTVYFGKAIVQIILPIKNPRKEIIIHLPPVTAIQSFRDLYKLEKIDLTDNLKEKRDWVFQFQHFNHPDFSK